MMVNRCATSRSVKAEVGSSMISTSDSYDTALAISTIWRLAIDRSRTSACGSSAMFSRANSAAVIRFISRWSTKPSRVFGSRRIQMFSATVMNGIRLSS
jgi:hypothetical protein